MSQIFWLLENLLKSETKPPNKAGRAKSSRNLLSVIIPIPRTARR